MLNTLLTLNQPLFVLDLETTSLDVKEARIVEIAFQRWEASGMTKEWTSRVNPGIPIPAAASKVHGIFDADVASKPTFKQLAVNLAKGLSDCSFANQNIRFDLRILAAEFARAGQAWSYAGARIIDSYQLERLAVPRNLSALYEKYVRIQCLNCGGMGTTTHDILFGGTEHDTEERDCKVCNGLGNVGEKHDGAHGALSDVLAAATVIARQLETFPNLPRDLDKLHDAQWPGEIDTEGRFRFINGVACVAFGKWNGKAISSVDTSYWDWICSNDFSPEVKAIAERAKMGQYPEAR